MFTSFLLRGAAVRRLIELKVVEKAPFPPQYLLKRVMLVVVAESLSYALLQAPKLVLSVQNPVIIE